MVETYRTIGEALTKGCERCVLTGYADPITGEPTNGWGNTGAGVRVGVTITQEQADYDLDRNWDKADTETQAAIGPTSWATLGEHQKAALVDFVFNTGCDKTWTIWSIVKQNQRDADWIKAVCDQLSRFDKAHVQGKIVTVSGLDHRRDAEIACFKTGDVALATAIANSAIIPPPSSGYLRNVPTPPMPSAPKTLAKTSLGLKVSGLVAGAGGLVAKNLTPDTQASIQNVHDTVVAHASELGKFAHLATNLTGAAVVAIAAGALLVHVTQQEAAKK